MDHAEATKVTRQFMSVPNVYAGTITLIAPVTQGLTAGGARRVAGPRGWRLIRLPYENKGSAGDDGGAGADE